MYEAVLCKEIIDYAEEVMSLCLYGKKTEIQRGQGKPEVPSSGTSSVETRSSLVNVLDIVQD